MGFEQMDMGWKYMGERDEKGYKGQNETSCLMTGYITTGRSGCVAWKRTVHLLTCLRNFFYIYEYIRKFGDWFCRDKGEWRIYVFS